MTANMIAKNLLLLRITKRHRRGVNNAATAMSLISGAVVVTTLIGLALALLLTELFPILNQ